jgi:hypothetical protein
MVEIYRNFIDGGVSFVVYESIFQKFKVYENLLNNGFEVYRGTVEHVSGLTNNGAITFTVDPHVPPDLPVVDRGIIFHFNTPKDLSGYQYIAITLKSSQPWHIHRMLIKDPENHFYFWSLVIKGDRWQTIILPISTPTGSSSGQLNLSRIQELIFYVIAGKDSWTISIDSIYLIA